MPVSGLLDLIIEECYSPAFVGNRDIVPIMVFRVVKDFDWSCVVYMFQKRCRH